MPRLKSQTLTAEFVGSRDLNRTPSIGSNDSFGSTGKGEKRRKKKVSDFIFCSILPYNYVIFFFSSLFFFFCVLSSFSSI